MKHIILAFTYAAFLAPLPAMGQSIEKKWTLQECIDYALANNISLKKNQMQKLSAKEDVDVEDVPSINMGIMEFWGRIL